MLKVGQIYIKKYILSKKKVKKVNKKYIFIDFNCESGNFLCIFVHIYSFNY